ncbi:MAG: hypothetical protein ACFFBK_09680, partial [Promethearchaeota archaeon]
KIENETFTSQIKTIKELLENVNRNLIEISKKNLNKFLDFQDLLIRKYKENYKNTLKKLKINKDIAKELGLFLINDKKVSKIIDSVSFIPSIDIPNWILLLDSLKFNTLFLNSIKRLIRYYRDLLQVRLNKQLSLIPEGTDPNLIESYRKSFKKKPNLTFDGFLKTHENRLSEQELEAKIEIIKKVKEKEELEKLKQKQEEQKEAYENYLKLSDKEFERLRRKESREKLKDISTETKKKNEIEISDEVSKKIKKFKSQFEKSFKETYMIQENEEKDPIDLIRERKKKKEKEYKQYKDHFKNQ